MPEKHYLMPPLGFEPKTHGFRSRCSTIELWKQKFEVTKCDLKIVFKEVVDHLLCYQLHQLYQGQLQLRSDVHNPLSVM